MSDGGANRTDFLVQNALPVLVLAPGGLWAAVWAWPRFPHRAAPAAFLAGMAGQVAAFMAVVMAAERLGCGSGTPDP